MTQAKIFYGTIFPGSSAVFLARVVGEYSETLKRRELLSGKYSAYLVDPLAPEILTPVPGRQNVELDLDSVFFNALQMDPSWDCDSEGFNFRHVPELGDSELFVLSQRFYQLDYEFRLLDEKRLPARIQFRVMTR
ncbi:MAG: hypothetical protein J6A23_06265 [Thermoguttaceae bacterium]|nr:hypothetical protein [Thermoguttaceae bacterium]MBP3695022.1 hypothetical protein [Thermoguttaceae bacterium]